MTLAAGSRLGPYEIVSPLGAGGMGEVYRAKDTRLGREVAVKVLPERFAGDAELVRRFEREARAVAALSHPNILTLFDFGREGELLYAVSELLDGETLRTRLAHATPGWAKAVEIAVAVADGLSHAGYNAWGYGGQLLIVVPKLELIAVFTGWNIYDKPELDPRAALERVLASVRP